MAKDYRQTCRTLLAEKKERLNGIKVKFQNEQAKERIRGKRSITAHVENQNANIRWKKYIFTHLPIDYLA